MLITATCTEMRKRENIRELSFWECSLHYLLTTTYRTEKSDIGPSESRVYNIQHTMFNMLDRSVSLILPSSKEARLEH